MANDIYQADFSKVKKLIEAGDLLNAHEKLSLMITENLGNKELAFAIRCVDFWAEVFTSLEGATGAFERGQLLVNRWKPFITKFMDDHIRKRGVVSDSIVNSMRKCVFNQAIKQFETLLDEKDATTRAGVLRKIGLCYKKLGDYDAALKYLQEGNSVSTWTDSAIVAELADCNALCGNDKNAKVLFREAFYMNAQKVELDTLESKLICALIDKVQQNNYTIAQLKEWIPVYGTIYGVFNIKRALRATEVGELKQKIFAMENELKNPASDALVLTPRLINAYLRLIDYYTGTQDNDERMNELLLKIKVLDKDIYALYAK